MGEDPQEVRNDQGDVVGSLGATGGERSSDTPKSGCKNLPCGSLSPDWTDSWLAERLYQQRLGISGRLRREPEESD
jgi:hypothetical protein